MNPTLAFLQQVGADAGLRHADDDALRDALTGAAVAPSVRDAILGRDGAALALLTGSRVIANKIITPGKEHEDEDDAEENDEPERKDESARPLRRDAAATP